MQFWGFLGERPGTVWQPQMSSWWIRAKTFNWTIICQLADRAPCMTPWFYLIPTLTERQMYFRPGVILPRLIISASPLLSSHLIINSWTNPEQPCKNMHLKPKSYLNCHSFTDRFRNVGQTASEWECTWLWKAKCKSKQPVDACPNDKQYPVWVENASKVVSIRLFKASNNSCSRWYVQSFKTRRRSHEKSRRDGPLGLVIRAPRPLLLRDGIRNQGVMYGARSANWRIMVQLKVFALIHQLDLWGCHTVPGLSPKKPQNCI